MTTIKKRMDYINSEVSPLNNQVYNYSYYSPNVSPFVLPPSSYISNEVIWISEWGLFVTGIMKDPSFSNVSFYFFSADGYKWEYAKFPLFVDGPITSMCYSPELDVLLLVSIYRVFSMSYNGNDLVLNNSSFTNDNSQAYHQSVCWSKELGKFILSTKEGMYSSENGFTWIFHTALFPSSHCWSPELRMFLAIMDKNLAPDGKSWSNELFFSYDGMEWHKSPLVTPKRRHVHSFYSEGHFTVQWCAELGLFWIFIKYLASSAEGGPLYYIINVFSRDGFSNEYRTTWVNFNTYHRISLKNFMFRIPGLGFYQSGSGEMWDIYKNNEDGDNRTFTIGNFSADGRKWGNLYDDWGKGIGYESGLSDGRVSAAYSPELKTLVVIGKNIRTVRFS